MPKMAMQMTAPWKPQYGFHRALEISQRTRDSHIRTAKTRFDLVVLKERRTDTREQSLDQQLVSVATPVVAGFEVSIDGRFSGVHRGWTGTVSDSVCLRRQALPKRLQKRMTPFVSS
jgi:hypothetical protein